MSVERENPLYGFDELAAIKKKPTCMKKAVELVIGRNLQDPTAQPGLAALGSEVVAYLADNNDANAGCYREANGQPCLCTATLRNKSKSIVNGQAQTRAEKVTGSFMGGPCIEEITEQTTS